MTSNSFDLVVTTATATGTAPEIIAHLIRHAQEARGAYATNTERALRANTAVFTTWCIHAGLPALPASPETVARFIDAMGERKAPATVRRYVSSVAKMHLTGRVPNPCTAEVVAFALKRLHRAKGRAQAQAAPITDVLLARMMVAAGSSLRDLRNKALLAVAFSTLARRSELAAMLRADWSMNGTASTITIRRSKTDQEGLGKEAAIIAPATRHVAAWVETAGIEDGPLFRAVLKGGRVGGPIDGADVGRIFKSMAMAAGLSPEEAARISGHSTRVGAAQTLVRHGVAMNLVMDAGRWKTPEMAARYASKLTAIQGGMMQIADRVADF